MRHSRRTTPLPHDFMHTLAALNLTSSSLDADLVLSIPAAVTLPPLYSATDANHPLEDSITAPLTLPFLTPVALAETDFDPSTQEEDKQLQRRRHIPAHFPVLPPAHAYRETPVFTPREVDARQIRERATAEGMEAEKALRKLVKASKSGTKKRRVESESAATGGLPSAFAMGTSSLWASEEDMWRETLKEVIGEGKSNTGGDVAIDGDALPDVAMKVDGRDSGGSGVEEDSEISVNWERAFWRKGNRGGSSSMVV